MSDQRPIPDPGTSPGTLRERARALPMRVTTATFVTPTDEHLRFIRQMGVTDIILWVTTFRSPRNPGGGAVSFKELLALRNQAEAHGLRVFAVETLPIQLYEKLIFGEVGREQQLQHYIETIRNTGRAGIPVLGYNWMPQGVWRTTLTAPLRGGASSTGFALAEAENAPLIRGRRFTEEECWDNYAWFLERVLPVAEDEDVTLAAHPNDPPVESLGGVPCLLRSRANFDKALSIRPSKNHGASASETGPRWARMLSTPSATTGARTSSSMSISKQCADACRVSTKPSWTRRTTMPGRSSGPSKASLPPNFTLH